MRAWFLKKIDQVETGEKWVRRKGIQCEMAKINILGNLWEMWRTNKITAS